MRGYRLIVPLAFLALLALGIFVLFSTGSDLAITVILLFIPAMVGVSFLVRYLVTVRKRSVTERVMERDVMQLANRYLEERRILHDFETKYGISTKEFVEDLRKVQAGLLELGCAVNGRIKLDRAKLREVVYADVEWASKLFAGIKDRHEVVLYARMMERCREYLGQLRELEGAGYANLRGPLEQLESKLRTGEHLAVELLELSLFMNEVASILDESLRICLRDAHRLEVEGRELANVDTSRIRTDMKIVERSMEHGNYENATQLLKSMIERLIALLKGAFDRYRAEALELAVAVSELRDTEAAKNEVEELKRGIVACTLPSQLAQLREHAERLISTSIATLEAVYTSIFELEAEIAKANPPTEVYPVEYWTRDKRGEVEALKSAPMTELSGFIRRYRLLASDAHSRLLYDVARLKELKATGNQKPYKGGTST